MIPPRPGQVAAGTSLPAIRLPLSGAQVGLLRQFHVRRDARDALQLPADIFSIGGSLLRADVASLQRISAWLGGAASTAELFAAMASHEVLHLLLLELRKGGSFSLQVLADRLSGHGLQLDGLQRDFAGLFPAGTAQPDGVEPLELLEEILLLHLHNRNPAFQALNPLLHDTELRRHGAYSELVRLVDDAASGSPLQQDSDQGLLTALRRLLEPQLRRPDSLTGQLELLELQLGGLAGDGYGGLMERLLLATDMLREEQAPRFTGQPGPGPAPVTSFSGGLLGDSSPPASATDEDWMANVVIVAKSCLVWLGQLSVRYGRNISRLDQIPDEELAELARAGFNALWLIGIWQRSEASRRIKRLRGQPDAEASAYAIHDHVIDGALGGEDALERLRQRASRHGLRLVCDMVPNHTGMDSRWVMERPEWFMQLPEPPFPAYSFTGPDLSGSDAVALRLEDHYWDGSDAAVVFERTDRSTGERRYIYHGNDGTGLPWNDTAQLDYLKPEVRSAVIDTMVQIAHKFPIIRFDAAMTLVRRHIQRLWYPPPGQGGAIASRALHGSMPAEEFARRLPQEFWLEATRALQREAPGTLLLAEAFWMLEGYFVRNLGMHRVYNSAFMHMLREADNAGFRDLVAGLLQDEPAVLDRLVNFLNNPDEESAASQFGHGDRYFGVCTLLATMPGLPMFGHGQLEGLQEKYGMEFTAARLVEDARPDVLARHEAEIYPLLRRRGDFASSERFELFDFSEHGNVDQDVIAYSNRAGLVVFNNSPRATRGRLQLSRPRRRGDDAGATSKCLHEALDLSCGPADFVVWRRLDDGLEYLLRARDLMSDGLELELGAYGKAVLLDFRCLTASAQLPLDQLAARLGGSGAHDVLAAAGDLAWGELRSWLLELVNTGAMGPAPALPDGSTLGPATQARLADRAGRLRLLLMERGPARAWESLQTFERLLLLASGIDDTLDTKLAMLVPGLPPFLLELPWRHDPGWWQSTEVQSWLQVHEAQGGAWFRQEPFDRLTALFALRAALRAGSAAGGELYSALQAAQRFSGWRPGRLARALDGSSDG